ncbi:MAG: hypothetical protein GY862_14090 [Gammaproteobacteria bacterium]|nr:hypothetical protein [Gammaproteobacteria bacterium]
MKLRDRLLEHLKGLQKSQLNEALFHLESEYPSLRGQINRECGPVQFAMQMLLVAEQQPNGLTSLCELLKQPFCISGRALAELEELQRQFTVSDPILQQIFTETQTELGSFRNVPDSGHKPLLDCLIDDLLNPPRLSNGEIPLLHFISRLAPRVQKKRALQTWVENTARALLLSEEQIRGLLMKSKTTKNITAQPAPLIKSDGCILISSITKMEVRAILETFSRTSGKKPARQIIGGKTYYNLGIHGGVQVFMVQSEMGTATPGGSLLTVSRAIRDLHPQAVIMCGIAFGLHQDKQQLGDILIAKQIQYYEFQKTDLQLGHIARGDRTTASERLLDRFRSGDNHWLEEAQTHFGLILSGEKLVNDPDFRDSLLKEEPAAIGGEMEGAGLYAAARDAKVDWILVKAICDWADGSKNDEAQSLAARNAAQFVLYVLELGGWERFE